MNIIETTAPISIENLQKYFIDRETKFLIDYENSTLKGSKLLIYLSNLDIPCDIKIDDRSDSFYDLLKDYFNSIFIVNIPVLEDAAMKVLFLYKNLIHGEVLEKCNVFISNNLEIVQKWINVLDSLVLYNIFIIQGEEYKEYQEYVKSFPKGDDEKISGINFVNLLKHEIFYHYYDNMNLSHLKYYEKYFNDYIFKGKNLFGYWAVKQNPMFLLSSAYANKLIDFKIQDEEKNDSLVR